MLSRNSYGHNFNFYSLTYVFCSGNCRNRTNNLMMSARLQACVGSGTVLPYCHSYHFSETSLCSLYFATDFSGLRKSGYLFALNKEKKCGLLCFHFLEKQRNVSQVPNSNGCHHKSLCMYRSGKWSPRYNVPPSDNTLLALERRLVGLPRLVD